VSDQSGAGKKTGWGALGHQWITAIAALITALTGAGFFIGRASAPNGGVAQPAPVTTTVTVQSSVGGSVSPASSSKAQQPADPDAYYSGQFTWGDANLDLIPPAPVDQGDIAKVPAEDALLTSGGSRLKVWADSGTPGRDQCRTTALSQGSSDVEKLHPGSVVCGVTALGRPFRLTVSIAGDNGIITDVLVWNK
jgi:hypothetical protein